jgi:hypothetical protein
MQIYVKHLVLQWFAEPGNSMPALSYFDATTKLLFKLASTEFME